jgi:hypothetical protein
MPTQIQLRRDTAADWTSNNPTLAAGELGYETDTTKFKVGDGTTAWTGLAYNTSAGGATINNQAENRLTTIGSTTTELDGEANLTFDGSTLTLTGTAALDGVTIADNQVTATRSNDNLVLDVSGTGLIQVKDDLSTDTIFTDWWGSSSNIKDFTVSRQQSLDADTTGRTYGSAFAVSTTLTNGSSSNSDFRPRTFISTSGVDMAGYDYTVSSFSRGPLGLGTATTAKNTSATTASTLATARGTYNSAAIVDYGSNSQDITINNAIANYSQVAIESNSSGTSTITNGYGFYYSPYTDNLGSAGTTTLTNSYGYYTTGTGGTNNYAFYSNNDTAESRIGTLERYREKINALTSSSTITVDCGLAPVHTVTLGTNTQFNIANLGTGQSVTLIITQDGTGSRTATFGTDTSTAVKFAGGAPTLSTGNGDIDIVTIFNDGTNYYGSCAKDFS